MEWIDSVCSESFLESSSSRGVNQEVTVTGAQGQFGNPEQEKRSSLETVTKGPVKTQRVL
jgi:hypothetical protein